MPDTLPVDLNREELHAVEVPANFESSDSFAVELCNHGEAVRVHLHLDDELSEVASVGTANHYVEAGATHEVPVRLHEHRNVRGKLKVVSGYGALTRWVGVEITEPDEDAGDVVVDEDLAKPQPREAGGGASPAFDRPELPVLGLSLVALLAAITAAVTTGSTAVAAGATLVLVAVVVAAYLVLT